MDGFGAALAEWIAWRMAFAAAVVAVLCAAIGLYIGWLCFAPAPSPADWDTWLRAHRKTCPTCKRAWDTAASAMCEEAFAKLQEEAFAKLQEELRKK